MENTTAQAPCPGCSKKGFHNKYMGHEGKRMVRTGECFECAFWELRCKAGADLVINHFVYSIGYEPADEDARYRARQRSDLGMSGRRFDIEFFDGRKYTTHNLWAGGEIPERFRVRLPDTARFISGERAQVGDITCWNPTDERTPAYPAYPR